MDEGFVFAQLDSPLGSLSNFHSPSSVLIPFLHFPIEGAKVCVDGGITVYSALTDVKREVIVPVS